MTLTDTEQTLAKQAWAAYLVNLLLLPGAGFLALLWLYWRAPEHGAPFALSHLSMAIKLSLAAGLGLLLVPALLWLSLRDAQSAVVVILLWWVSCHAALVLLGALNLSRSMSQRWPLWVAV